MSKIITNNITPRSGSSVGLTGDLTASGNITGVDGTFTGNVSIGGTITYEDVANVDSVGIITAGGGVIATGLGVSVASGGVRVTGVVTATSYQGDGTALTLDTQDLTIRSWLFTG